MAPECGTIGVYGWDAARFFDTLKAAGVDTFCDLRARRGVRGREYAWANHARLEAALTAHGICYVHHRELAPSDAIRAGQYAADRAAGVAKRQRTGLSADFIAAYLSETLAEFDPAAFVAALGAGSRVVALFCVEREPWACHRSLVAERLTGVLDAHVTHLIP
jgi:uncharacterized protein (DUF488 family)